MEEFNLEKHLAVQVESETPALKEPCGRATVVLTARSPALHLFAGSRVSSLLREHVVSPRVHAALLSPSLRWHHEVGRGRGVPVPAVTLLCSTLSLHRRQASANAGAQPAREEKPFLRGAARALHEEGATL